MASEETERDLINALGALEDTRSQLLRTVDGLERLQVQLGRAWHDVEQIAGMTQRGGEWTADPEFSAVVLEQVRADSREVGTALADIGITQEEVGRHLDSADEYLGQARESLAAANARADYGPQPRETTAAIRAVRDQVAAANERVTATRASLRHADVSVAAGQAFLSSPITSPETARSVATGAQLRVTDAVEAATRSLNVVDDGRDRTTHSARQVADLATEAGRTASRDRYDDPRRENGPPSPGRHL